MGWRDRIKKSFEDFENIEKGVQNLKKPEKKRKEGLEVLFNYPPQNPQNPQNYFLRDTNSEEKKEGGVDCKSNIPAPNPPGLGPGYERIWNQAWRLADFIDDPAAAPLAARKARLPELLLMRDRMAKIERQGGTGSTPTEGKPPDYCPARCKRTGKCYGATWFTGRRGKPQSPPCNPKNCKWRN